MELKKAKLFQVQASRDGKVLAIAQREFPDPFDDGELQRRAREARDAVRAHADETGGGSVSLMLHEEPSEGFIRLCD